MKPMKWHKPNPYYLECGDYKILQVIAGDPKPLWWLLLCGKVIGRFEELEQAMYAAEMNRERFA